MNPSSCDRPAKYFSVDTLCVPHEWDKEEACCTPSRGDGADAQVTSGSPESTTAADTDRMVRIPAEEFLMGTDDVEFPEDDEGPVRTVELDVYYIDQHAVTNAEFYQFPDDTGYTTDAEEHGWSFVFQDFLGDEQWQYATGPMGRRGGSPYRAPGGLAPTGRGRASTIGSTTRSSTSPGRTRSRTASGRTSDSRWRRSGNARPSAASSRSGTPGGRTHRRRAPVQHLARGVPHPRHRG